MVLAAIDFDSSLTWAIFVAWIMSVVLHELGHGIVASLGGDHTVRERGGLTLNPLQYVDPVFSLLVPAIIFLLGGVPLPGGVTYVRLDLLKSRLWESAVSAAGPAVNFLLFLGCALPLHPKLRWVTIPDAAPEMMGNAVLFLGAFAWVQMLTCLYNLVPVPGLDGFGILRPWLDPQTREKLDAPELRRTVFFFWFILLWHVPAISEFFHLTIARTLVQLGFEREELLFFLRSFNLALFGRSS